MSNNEGLGAYYYITRPRLRIGTVIEQKFISQLLDRQVRKRDNNLHGSHCLMKGDEFINIKF